jgi:tetratricopeptide (TPR) repeat protein
MKMQEEQLVLSREIFGEKHPDTIRRMGLLARSYYLNTMYPEAQTTYNEQVRLSKEVWGETHAKTIDSMSDLASVLREIGDHAEAEHLYREALALLQKTYGKEYPATLTAMNNLGLTLTYSRQYTEAEALLKKGLLLEEKVRGKGNQEALVVMHNLAFLYTDQGRYSDAEELYQETLELHSGMYAPDHPEVLMSLEGLADALIGQGRHEEAFSLYQRVYNSRKKVLGSGNQRTRWARRKYLRTKKLLLGNNSADESDDDLSEYASSDNEGSTTEGHSASEANETIGEATAEFGNLETAESPNTRTSKNESFVVGDDNTPEPVPSQKLPRQGIPAVSSDGTKHNAPQPPHAGDETSLHQKTSAEIGHKPITTGPKSTSSNTSEPPGEEIPEFTNTTTSQEKQIQILSTDSELSATTILSSQSTSLQGPPAQQIPPDQSSAPPAGNRETRTLKSESEKERSEGARSSEVALRSKDKWRQRLNRMKFTR